MGIQSIRRLRRLLLKGVRLPLRPKCTHCLVHVALLVGPPAAPIVPASFTAHTARGTGRPNKQTAEIGCVRSTQHCGNGARWASVARDFHTDCTAVGPPPVKGRYQCLCIAALLFRAFAAFRPGAGGALQPAALLVLIPLRMIYVTLGFLQWRACTFLATHGPAASSTGAQACALCTSLLLFAPHIVPGRPRALAGLPMLQ